MSEGLTPKNIFEAIYISEAAKRKKTLLIPSTPSQFSTATNLNSADTMLARCRKIHEDLTRSLQKSFEENNLPYTKYKTYITDKRNFTKAEWTAVQEGISATENQLHILSTKLPKVEPIEEKKPIVKEESKPTVKRKGLSRNRWIRME